MTQRASFPIIGIGKTQDDCSVSPTLIVILTNTYHHDYMKKEYINYKIIVDKELLEFLRPEEGKKFSKMDALCDLLDKASGEKREKLVYFGTVVTLRKGQFVTTVSSLAKQWKWHRATARGFLDTLENFGMAKIDAHKKFFLITMNYTLPETEGLQPSLMTPEEEHINKWICGYLSLEEMAESAVQFITSTENLLAMPVTDKGQGVGERLHKLFSHIILQQTNLFPANPLLSDALEKMYCEVCHRNLTMFLQLLSSAGLSLIAEQHPELPQLLPPSILERASESLHQLWEYYAPYFEKTPQKKVGKTFHNEQ